MDCAQPAGWEEQGLVPQSLLLTAGGHTGPAKVRCQVGTGALWTVVPRPGFWGLRRRDQRLCPLCSLPCLLSGPLPSPPVSQGSGGVLKTAGASCAGGPTLL